MRRRCPAGRPAISAGPADESGQTLTFSTTNNNNALFSGQPYVSASGTLTYTPAPNANGSATVTVRLTDNGGTANGGDDYSEQTFTITVTPVNDAPSRLTAVRPATTINENDSVTVIGEFRRPRRRRRSYSHDRLGRWLNEHRAFSCRSVRDLRLHISISMTTRRTPLPMLTIQVAVTDNGTPQGAALATTGVTVKNVAPAISNVTGPGTPVARHDRYVTATFTDVGTQTPTRRRAGPAPSSGMTGQRQPGS